jgi:hypothetical protein
VPGGVPLAVDLDDAGAGQPAAAAQQPDALGLQPVLGAGVGVVRDHEVPPGQRRGDVHLGAGGRFPGLVHSLAGAQQGLRRDAGVVGALAADQLALDHRDPEPAVDQLAGAVLARRAGAEHDDVEVAHVGSSCPACSRTM